MGDTSSGKSSLLTSIAEVELPSSEKLTTRCPIMLQMKRAEKRMARVTIQWKGTVHKFHSRDVDDTSWHKLTGYIAEAQAFIIDKSASKAVARDVVSVKVEGPRCEDLTLIDLPGIVRATGAGESATLAEDIQCLIDDYMKNSRCVILAVIPANVDFHNSQIMADAKKVDPETKRTLPVITKPDLIDTGAEEDVKELLLGRKTNTFEKGFHMVKGRGQAALNKNETIEEGLKKEETFFRNTQPWRDVEARSLFGTKELRIKLGDLQMQLIRETFPMIVREMRAHKLSAEEKLLKMGTACVTTTEKRQFYNYVTRNMIKSLQANLLGLTLHSKNPQEREDIAASARFHERCDEFKQVVHRGRLASSADIRQGDKIIATHGDKEFKGVVALTSEDGANAYLDIDGVSGTADADIFMKLHPVKTERTPGDVWVDSSNRVCLANRLGTYYFLNPFPLKKVKRDPEWIRAMISNHRPYDLAVFVNVNVFNSIVESFIDEDWLKACKDFVKSVSDILKDGCQRAIDEEAGIHVYRYPRLKHHFGKQFEKGLDFMIASANEKVLKYVEQEKIPYTQNDDLNKELTRLRSKWIEESLIEALGLTGSSQLLDQESLSKASVKTAIDAIFSRNRDMAMDYHMAEDMGHVLHAYGKIAEKRFIDRVPMICGELLRECPTHMEDVFFAVSTDDLEKLIADSPNFKRNYHIERQKAEDFGKALAAVEELY